MAMALFFCMAMLVSGCNTGIERTKTVTLSRGDMKILQPSAEDLLMDSIHPQPLKEWRKGKPFTITDNKAAYIYEITDANGFRATSDSLAGKTIYFNSVSLARNPGGEETPLVEFSLPADGKMLRFHSNKKLSDMEDAIYQDFPLLIDLDMIADLNRLLKDRTLWIKTNLWYGPDNTPVKGEKFRPVTVLSATPGNLAFPIFVNFSDGKTTASVPMNYRRSASGFESRSFSALFYLSDPRNLYPGITPETWEHICRGELAPGMTKEECKLSVGNPKDVEAGHDWNSVVDYWKYTDGSYLLFQDGRLVDYRK